MSKTNNSPSDGRDEQMFKCGDYSGALDESGCVNPVKSTLREDGPIADDLEFLYAYETVDDMYDIEARRDDEIDCPSMLSHSEAEVLFNKVASKAISVHKTDPTDPEFHVMRHVSSKYGFRINYSGMLRHMKKSKKVKARLAETYTEYQLAEMANHGDYKDAYIEAADELGIEFSVPVKFYGDSSPSERT